MKKMKIFRLGVRIEGEHYCKYYEIEASCFSSAVVKLFKKRGFERATCVWLKLIIPMTLDKKKEEQKKMRLKRAKKANLVKKRKASFAKKLRASWRED